MSVCFSLVKMVYAFAAKTGKQPTRAQVIASMRRNFGGLDSVDPAELFQFPAYLENEEVNTCFNARHWLKLIDGLVFDLTDN